MGVKDTLASLSKKNTASTGLRDKFSNLKESQMTDDMKTAMQWLQDPVMLQFALGKEPSQFTKKELEKSPYGSILRYYEELTDITSEDKTRADRAKRILEQHGAVRDMAFNIFKETNTGLGFTSSNPSEREFHNAIENSRKKGVEPFYISPKTLDTVIKKHADRYLKDPKASFAKKTGGFQLPASKFSNKSSFIIFNKKENFPKGARHETEHFVSQEEHRTFAGEDLTQRDQNWGRFDLGSVGGREMYFNMLGNKPLYTQEFTEKLVGNVESQSELMDKSLSMRFPESVTGYELGGKPILDYTKTDLTDYPQGFGKQPRSMLTDVMESTLRSDTSFLEAHGVKKDKETGELVGQDIKNTPFFWDISKEETRANAAEFASPEEIYKRGSKFGMNYMAKSKSMLPKDIYNESVKNKRRAITKKFGEEVAKDWDIAVSSNVATTLKLGQSIFGHKVDVPKQVEDRIMEGLKSEERSVIP